MAQSSTSTFCELLMSNVLPRPTPLGAVTKLNAAYHQILLAGCFEERIARSNFQILRLLSGGETHRKQFLRFINEERAGFKSLAAST
jgi:hypothetical protein